MSISARRGRTIRTVTCDLPALTEPMRSDGVDRMAAGPEVMIDLPRFEGHMLRAPLVPASPRSSLLSGPSPAVDRPAVARPSAPRPLLPWWKRLMQMAGPRRRVAAR